jgi:hypothetical protein
MGFLEGLLGGFDGRRREVEQVNRESADRASDRESRVFQALLASPDPEVQALAVTGMLESTQPKAKKRNFAGFLGQYEQSDTYNQLINLAKTPKEVEETRPGTPSMQLQTQTMRPAPTIQQGTTQAPPPTGSAAMSPTAITGVGAPPPQPLSWQNKQGPPTTEKVMRPRQLFQTPEQMAIAGARGKAQGDVEGEVAGLIAVGFTDVEARDLVKQEYQRRLTAAGGYQSVSGEVPDGNGSWRQVYGIFDRVSGKYLDPMTRAPLEGFRQRTNTAAQRFGVDREALARAKYGKDFRDLSQTEAADIITQEQDQLRREGYNRTLGTAQGKMDSPADLDASRLNNVPVGTTPNQVQNQVVPQQAIVDRHRSISQLREQLGRITGDGTPNNPGMLGVLPKNDSLGGLAPGVALAAARRMPSTRAQVAQLESAINNIVNVIARSVAEQRGTQTEKDAERAEAAILSLRDQFLKGDTQESAKARIDETLVVLDQILSRLPPVPQIGAPPPGAGTPPPKPGPQGNIATPGINPAAPTPQARQVNGKWVISVP